MLVVPDLILLYKFQYAAYITRGWNLLQHTMQKGKNDNHV